MGGLCSTPNRSPAKNPYAGSRNTGLDKQYEQQERQRQRQVLREASRNRVVTPQPAVQEPVAAEKESPRVSVEKGSPRVAAEKGLPRLSAEKGSPRVSEEKGLPRLSPPNANDDEFYDGIPRYQKSSSYLKSRSLRANKVSEVGSLLGRAGSAGLGRAVEVLDSLGTSVSNLNLKGGFVSGASNKSNELSIVSFEVANTIVKGSNLMQSLSKRSMRQLKEAVLTEKGVQQLISDDMNELLRIVARDKREELKVFAGEVIRFGNRCKDPQWHNLDRFFEKRSRDRTPQKQLQETAETVMVQLMTSVQLTAELYQELHTLDKMEHEYQLKRLEELRFNAAKRGDKDNSLTVMATETKNQKKLVKNLKKKSLWSKSMDEIMGKLFDIVLFLNQEINHSFGNPVEIETLDKEINGNQQKLGPAGLALHYANIILHIDSIVARSSSMTQSSRDALYQSLPPNLKDSLRPKLQSFHVEKELTVTEIKDEMENTLHWLVPVATNTAKAHHGFGWVGEWGNTGSESNSRAAGPMDIMQIETLHHADKQKTEGYILNLLVWLNYLVSRSKATANGDGAAIGSKTSANGGGAVVQSFGSDNRSPSNESDQQSAAKDASQSQL